MKIQFKESLSINS